MVPGMGGLSATKPNLQQQPSPEKGTGRINDWRKIYLPEEGAQWACCDYSQQEVRWTTHFAAIMGLPQAGDMARAYSDNPDLDNHQFMADLTKLDRSEAKTIYLGLCYGEGGAKLCKQLRLPTRWALSRGPRKVKYFETRAQATLARKDLASGGRMWEAAGEEGQAIMDKFNAKAPFIRMLAKRVQERAQQRGYIITKGHRHLHFPQKDDGSFDYTYRALNRLIQGTSADQTKKAMVQIDRAGFWLALQAHDETDSSVMDRDEAEEIGEIMRTTMDAVVPFKVDVEIGQSWGEVT